jgi:hypothetical protein
MKTNVIMKSSDRILFGQVIRQETKTGMLNISDLETIAAKRNALNGYSIKQTSELISRKDNIERIFYILKKQNIINIDISTFIEQVESNGIITTLKKVGAWKTTGARQTKTSYANGYIWLLLALEFSPEIYGESVIWLGDSLIINRIEAGNMYIGLGNAVSKFKNVDYSKMAKALNYIIFDKHETGIRNTGNQSQLKALEDLEKNLAFAIDMGLIKSFDEVITLMRKEYKKYQPH